MTMTSCTIAVQAGQLSEPGTELRMAPGCGSAKLDDECRAARGDASSMRPLAAGEQDPSANNQQLSGPASRR